jgi:hypothetical protein
MGVPVAKMADRLQITLKRGVPTELVRLYDAAIAEDRRR